MRTDDDCSCLQGRRLLLPRRDLQGFASPFRETITYVSRRGAHRAAGPTGGRLASSLPLASSQTNLARVPEDSVSGV